MTSNLAPRRKKVAFVTIGQSPRDDIVPEMLGWIGPGVEPRQVGALDGLSRDEIAALAPRAGDHTLVSRLRDGSEVKLGQTWTRKRLQALMDDLDGEGLDLVVLLCTGDFEGLHSHTLMVEAQRVTDHAVEMLAEDGRAIGVMLPDARQIGEFHQQAAAGTALALTHASPYTGDRFEEAARELARSDVIVMHCMGYDEAMRRRVAAVTGKPVLLARRLVASMVAQLI
jgi:protein AroM